MNVNVAILVDAKNEYTKQLQQLLVNHLYEGFEKIYDHKDINLNLSPFENFQNNLSKIPTWNQELVDMEANRILEKSECNWFDELLKAVFVANVKILTAVKNKKKLPKIELRVPTFSHFIHKCYHITAKEFYKNPYLFDKTVRNSERQSNLRTSLKIIESCISESIRKLLPFRQILNNYLRSSIEEDDDVSNKKLKKFNMIDYSDNEEVSDEEVSDDEDVSV